MLIGCDIPYINKHVVDCVNDLPCSPQAWVLIKITSLLQLVNRLAANLHLLSNFHDAGFPVTCLKFDHFFRHRTRFKWLRVFVI